MSPQFVKPYVKSNKNDMNDGEAICEAVGRPSMRFVAIKSVEQQDIQALHRIRSRLVANRTALANQVRGLLLELGIPIRQGIRHLRSQFPMIIKDQCNALTLVERDYLSDLYTELVDLDEKVSSYGTKLAQISRQSEECRRLMKISGVGVLSATALVAAVRDAKSFRNGRHMAAWLGLVPRQNSSGRKTRLQGISKRGETYLRTLLIHEARAVTYHQYTKDDERYRWLQDVCARRGINRAVVAQANKSARIIWAVLAKAEDYRHISSAVGANAPQAGAGE